MAERIVLSCKVKVYSREPSELIREGEEITVLIEDLSKIKAGAPKGDATTFVIETRPLGWKVNRTYRDFAWLHKSLSGKYPIYYVKEF